MAQPVRDPLCLLAEVYGDRHICTTKLGEPTRPGQRCYTDERQAMFDDRRHGDGDDLHLVTTDVLVALVDVALGNGCRTQAEQHNLLRACRIIDADPITYLLVDRTSEAILSWRSKPCRGDHPAFLTVALPLDGPDLCPECGPEQYWCALDGIGATP